MYVCVCNRSVRWQLYFYLVKSNRLSPKTAPLLPFAANHGGAVFSISVLIATPLLPFSRWEWQNSSDMEEETLLIGMIRLVILMKYADPVGICPSLSICK
ncbi:hypothetical protein ACSBR1_004237 [Camellia fascicularis]